LTAELASLEQAISDTKERAEQKQAKGSRALDTLTQTLVSLKHTNNELSENGLLSERARSQPQREALLERTLLRVQNSLSKQQSPLAPRITTEVELLPQASAEILNHIAHKGSIRLEQNATWFGEGGTEQTSDVLWLSELSAIALAPEGGALFATETGELRQDLDSDKKIQRALVTTARALTASPHPGTLRAFLFDPNFPSNNHFSKTKSLLETVESGGLVMWPILLLALIAFGITLERLWNLNLVHTNAEHLMVEVDEFIQQGQWQRADESCERNPGVVARVMEAILDHKELTREQMEDRATEVILSCRPSLERFLSGLNIIAAVSPLLGLLGTVTGMIATFLVITEHGTGDPRLMAGGISEALLTTQFGLMVAIPALMAHALLNRWVEHILGDIETNSLKLLNSIERLPLGHLSAGSKVIPLTATSQGRADG